MRYVKEVPTTLSQLAGRCRPRTRVGRRAVETAKRFLRRAPVPRLHTARRAPRDAHAIFAHDVPRRPRRPRLRPVRRPRHGFPRPRGHGHVHAVPQDGVAKRFPVRGFAREPVRPELQSRGHRRFAARRRRAIGSRRVRASVRRGQTRAQADQSRFAETRRRGARTENREPRRESRRRGEASRRAFSRVLRFCRVRGRRLRRESDTRRCFVVREHA